MKTLARTLPLLVPLAAACASTPDRAPPQRADDVAAAPASEPAPATPARATPPLTRISVDLDPGLTTACGIAPPPAAFFEFDSATLDEETNRHLGELATCLASGPLAGRKIEVIGHTDPRGEDEYNRQLGRSRAESVEDYLHKQGVDQANIVTRSMGAEEAQGSDPSEYPLDRRVDIRLLPE